MNMRILVVAVVISCAMTGCATVQQSGAGAATTVQKTVSARAEARWQTLIAKDLDKAYEFLSPGSKAANPLAIYKAKIKPLDWRSAKVVAADCDNDKCSVKLNLSFVHQRAGGEIATIIEETWIKDSGSWWFVFNG